MLGTMPHEAHDSLTRPMRASMDVTSFRPNRRFRREYKKLFERDPLTANTFLLLCELADEKGQVFVAGPGELAKLMAARFEDPKEWQL